MKNSSVLKFLGAGLSIMFLFVVTPHLAAQTPPGWKVQITGVRVVAPAPEGRSNLRAFNWSPGITVALLLTSPEKNIISVAKDKSKITSFTDDKSTDLLAAEPGTIDYSSWLNSDSAAGKSVSVEAKVSSQPAKGAAQFNLAGKFLVETASQLTNIAVENVALKVGSQFNIGQIKFTISGVRLQGKDFVLTLQADQDLAAVSHLDFYDANGTKIESHKYSSSSWSSAGSTSISWDFTLKKQADQATVRAAVWTDLKSIEVPFSTKVSLGL